MTISTYCGAEVSYHTSPEGTCYMSCRKCLKPCDIKPMKHEVKVGDRFKLGPWEWTVQEIYSASINAYHHKGGDFYHKLTLWLTDADQLDWIKPDVRFTREEAGRFYRLIEEYAALPLKVGQPHPSVKDFLYDHTDKE